MAIYMNWYQKTRKPSNPKLTKTASGHHDKMTKQAAEIDHMMQHISKDRIEEFIYFTSNRIHETSYYVQLTSREIDNSRDEPFWMTIITAFSFESGNIVYKKCIYHRKKEHSREDFKKAVKILLDLQHEQEANNLPTATLPTMIWHALHDIDGDKDLKPKASGNIVYLRQSHNINENKGNLFKNILYLDKANKAILEKDPKTYIHEQEGMF